MGIKYQILPDHNTILVSCSGKPVVPDYQKFFQQVKDDPHYYSEIQVLVDARNLEIEYRYRDLNSIIAMVNDAFGRRPKKSKVAVVVVNTVFAVATDIYNILQNDFHVKPFRDIESAQSWLGLSEEFVFQLDREA